MATLIPYGAADEPDALALKQLIANVVQSRFDAQHVIDHIVNLKGGAGGTDWATVGAAFGCSAVNAEALFTAANQVLAYAVGAYDASAPLDALRPV